MPVLILPTGNFALNLAASSFDAGSNFMSLLVCLINLPAAIDSLPIKHYPPKNVPVVSTTDEAHI